MAVSLQPGMSYVRVLLNYLVGCTNVVALEAFFPTGNLTVLAILRRLVLLIETGGFPRTAHCRSRKRQRL
jgi:hypothetical protein